MKAVFDEETARELGYQKYWPEWHDWLFATLGVLFVLAVVCIVAAFVYDAHTATQLVKQTI